MVFPACQRGTSTLMGKRFMCRGRGTLWFMCFVAGAAAFVGFTSRHLPDRVASHFDGSGAANGYMPHGFYVGFMLGVVVVLPALAVGLTWRSMASPHARINLPNKDYWLAPERRAETIAFLRAGVLWFGTLLITFLGYAHWLVVLANAVHPARLANAWLMGGLLVFLASLLVWLKGFWGHFRHRPPPSRNTR